MGAIPAKLEPALQREVEAYRKAARIAVRKFDAMAPRIVQAVKDGTPKNAIARELGWDRRRLQYWLNANPTGTERRGGV